MSTEKYMQKCLDLAKQGFPKSSPNPMVGCVIVHNDKIIGQGFHEQYGSHHAEVNAINSVSDKNLLEKSTLYVNLEPCAHYGKTPPCSNLIVKHKIPKVVIGTIDDYSEVAGKGILHLRKNGINVSTGVLKEKCLKLNRRFFTFHNKKRPYIILKWAESSDGFIAPKNQKEPFWMTSEKSKKLVHKWRSEETAILVGSNTVRLDNPKLTSRLCDGKNPIRLVIDKNLRLSSNFNVFDKNSKTFTINQIEHSDHKLKINFEAFFEELYEQLFKLKIQSIIIEGGKFTLDEFIKNDQWDEARVFTAPIILSNGLPSPNIFDKKKYSSLDIGNDILNTYFNQ